MDEDLSGTIGWEALNYELSSEYRKVLVEWETKLADTKLTEPDYLAYLREHAGFFFSDSGHRLITISELELGADLNPDFVVGEDRASYGFAYELIEVESPHDIVYTKQNRPSAHLTEAINQIQQWELWLEANRAEAKRLFPSKEFIVVDKPAFTYTIIIGRRTDTNTWSYLRNHFADKLRIQIRSFDYLTDRVKERRFYSLPLNFSGEMELVPISDLNQLANPFVQAYPSGTWRRMIHNPRLSYTHMVANNADMLLQERTLNSKQDNFIAAWNAFPLEKKAQYRKRLKDMRYPWAST